MASIRSGFKLKPWISFAGFDDCDMALGGIGPAAARDPCPYWQAHVAAQALMSCVPGWISSDWAQPGLLYFSVNNGNLRINIASVDAGENEFVTVKDGVAWTHKLRPGIMRSFAIAGSTSNNGAYTVAKMRIDGTAMRIKVNEPIR
jgi:hypothetical protein